MFGTPIHQQKAKGIENKNYEKIVEIIQFFWQKRIVKSDNNVWFILSLTMIPLGNRNFL
jgi:hypothetical protein